MAEESGGEQPQKTVAELLAQHGAQADGGRRRRRRAADDDDDAPETTGGTRRKPSMGDTAPQAIIDRVTADGGVPAPTVNRRRALPQDAPPQQVPQQSAPPQGGPPPQSGNFRVPQGQQDSGQLPRPVAPQPPPAPPQDSGQLPLPPRGRPTRQQPLPQQPLSSQQAPSSQQPLLPPPAAQEETRRRLPAARPPRAPAPPPPVAEPGLLAARLDGHGPAEGTLDDVEQPPQQMSSGGFQVPQAPPRRPRRPPARPAGPPAQEQHTEQIPVIREKIRQDREQAEPAAELPPAGLAGWRQKRSETAMDDTEIGVMPLIPEPPDGPQDAGPPTQTYRPPPPFAPQRAMPRDDPAAGGMLEDQHADDLDLQGPAGLGDQYDYDDDQLDEYEDEYEDDEFEPVAEAEHPPAEEESPGKQWLSLGWQLAAGVVGGAAVWLAFNWLWVKIPAAALVAALVVVVGLVWIVRKIRRAEDLQTTVLAVLVGLVVTVSPAALLLLSR